MGGSAPYTIKLWSELIILKFVTWLERRIIFPKFRRRKNGVNLWLKLTARAMEIIKWESITLSGFLYLLSYCVRIRSMPALNLFALHSINRLMMMKRNMMNLFAFCPLSDGNSTYIADSLASIFPCDGAMLTRQVGAGSGSSWYKYAEEKKKNFRRPLIN